MHDLLFVIKHHNEKEEFKAELSVSTGLKRITHTTQQINTMFAES